MKPLPLLALSAVFVLAAAGVADARVVWMRLSQGLHAKSDLAIEAASVAVNDTKERGDLAGQPVVGVVEGSAK